MSNLEIGATAPSFELPSSGGNTVRLTDFLGKIVVLYFYPKDDTPGCTAEACGFRDLNEEFQKSGAVILGISPDAPAKHDKFIGKYDLPFPLLSDENHQVAELYGVWKEKKMYGRTYMGLERTTFVINQSGKIEKIYPKVKVKGHMEEVLDFVRELNTEDSYK